MSVRQEDTRAILFIMIAGTRMVALSVFVNKATLKMVSTAVSNLANIDVMHCFVHPITITIIFSSIVCNNSL